MPVYEYRCERCEHLTEALRRMADADAEQACEKCGAVQTRRVQSVFASMSGGGDAGPGCGEGPCGMPMGGGMAGGCCGGGMCGMG
jgi:putative FmdB family regulatory protein